MAIITGGQKSKYFDSYSEIDVSFNRQVIQYTGLNPHDVFLRFTESQVPCIIYSSSMMGAKVLANLEPSHFEKIRESNNKVSLRFSFRREESSISRTFFIASKVTGFRPYNQENPKTNFVSLSYTQKPPDDLIEILGTLLDTNINSKKRKEHRIIIDDIAIRMLGLKSRASLLRFRDGHQKAFLRDLSFSGAKVLTAGSIEASENKASVLQLNFSDLDSPVLVPGRVVRTEDIGERNEITSVALHYDESRIPLAYKTRINQFFSKKK
jgi:hypothetical protein